MKHKTPDINPEKSNNLHAEYQAKIAKNTNPKKQHTLHTKKTKNNTVLCKNEKTPSRRNG